MTEEAPQLTKLQIYCSSLYDLWDRESAIVELSGGVKVKVWKGYITTSAASVGAGEGTYTRVVERLTSLGCVKVVEKGRRNSPSTVVLNYPPTAEIWDKKVSSEDLTTPPSSAMLLAEIKEVRRRTGDIDIIAAFTEVEKMLVGLETRLTEVERKQNKEVKVGE